MTADDPQVWSNGNWTPASQAGPLQVGTSAADGRVWDGQAWLDGASPWGKSLRRHVPGSPESATPTTAAASLAGSAGDPIARRLTGVIFGLIAVLCAVAAISMQPLFGRDAGGLAMLAALAAALGFGIAALVKSG